MDPRKRERLEAAGWKVGDAADFLGLSEAEAQYVETKVALGIALRKLREYVGLTQAATAEEIGSSQSRLAKMEKADPSVSLDLLFSALLKLGASPDGINRVFSSALGRAGRDHVQDVAVHKANIWASLRGSVLREPRSPGLHWWEVYASESDSSEERGEREKLPA